MYYCFLAIAESHIVNSSSQNRCREILQITDDRHYKVQPRFEFLNENFKKFIYSSSYSVDESIIPYYGKHGTKQFIWVLGWGYGVSDGYLVHGEPYCCRDTDLDETDLGQGPDVVLGLLEKANVTGGSTITCDNLFTTLPLLYELTKLGIGGIGTFRENRLQGPPIPKKTKVQKKERRFYDYASDGSNLVVTWRNNKAVVIATNYVSCEPISLAIRWSKQQKKQLDVPMPKPFKVYNSQMGGVDLFDQFVANYRVRIWPKKWMVFKCCCSKCMEIVL